MGKIIDFPGVEPGMSVALYTQNHLYSGTIVKHQSFPEGAGIWLEDVTVAPLKGQVPRSEVLLLNFVCVLWHQVVAVGFPPGFSQPSQPQ